MADLHFRRPGPAGARHWNWWLFAVLAVNAAAWAVLFVMAVR